MEKGVEGADAEFRRKLNRYVDQIVRTTGNFTGYENPGKSLYMLIREMVENSLDAIELAQVDDPYVRILVEPVDRDKITADGHYFKVSCQDNGIGVEHGDIPAMFAELLGSSKSEHRQTRGKFGMGVKNALLYSMEKTGHPMEVESEVKGKGHKSMYKLQMNIDTGDPIILMDARKEKDLSAQGTTVVLTLFGNWSTYRNNIINFISQTAMVTPYVRFNFGYIYKSKKRQPFERDFPRTCMEKNPSPRTAKYDPSSFFQRARSLPGGDSTLAQTLKCYLMNEFDGMDEVVATDFIGKLASPLSPDIVIKDLTYEQKNAIKEGFKDFSFKEMKCQCDCLTPLGGHLIAGVKFLLGDAVLLGECVSKPSSYEGHPYLVEAVITTLDSSATAREGYATIDKGLNIFRFANRTPLILEGTSDVIVQVAKKIRWDTWGLSKLEDKICIFVSFVSTYVPFTGLAKEAISGRQNIPTVIQEVLEGCCKDLLAKRKPDTSKKQRIVDAGVKYHLNMMIGCTKMADASGPPHVDDFNKERFLGIAALAETRSVYQKKLDARYMSLNKDKLI